MSDELAPLDADTHTTTPAPILRALDDADTMAKLWPFAQALAGSDLVPTAYRNKPANIVLVALYGQAMGLNLAEALQRIHVINGKPTMAAELIISKVREAGHKIETGWDAERKAAWCRVTRGDDGTGSTVWRTMAWAQAMKLTTKDQYRAQPEVMLQYRAATLGARLVCPDALFGVVYSTDEMRDGTGDEPLTRRVDPDAAPGRLPELTNATTSTADSADTPPTAPGGDTAAAVVE